LLALVLGRVTKDLNLQSTLTDGIIPKKLM